MVRVAQLQTCGNDIASVANVRQESMSEYLLCFA